MRNIELAVQRAGLKRLAGVAELEASGRSGCLGSRTVGHSPGPTAEASFSDAQLEALLGEYGLAAETPLSVLAIELIPEPNSPFDDPLRSELGEVRILRTSPLVAIEGVCC
jgi:hypothetical protein